MIKFTLTKKAAKKQKVNCNWKNEPEGFYVWIDSCGVVDWIVGFDKPFKFKVRKCYHTGNAWYYDLLMSFFRKKSSLRFCLWK